MAAVLRYSQNCAAAIAVLLSFILLVLTIIWVTAKAPHDGDKSTWGNVGLGGLSWTNLPPFAKDWNSFHWHPLCMVFGMVFCFSHAILVYRIPPWIGFTKRTRKMIHFTIQGVACISIIVGLVGIKRAHDDWKMANFTSVHSWFGLSVVVMFFMQWVAGFYSFWKPKLPDVPRAAYLPWHIWAGVFMYIMALATAGMGININNAFTDCDKGYGNKGGSLCTGALKMSHAIAFVIFWLGAATLWAVLPRKDDIPRCEPGALRPEPSAYHGNTGYEDGLVDYGATGNGTREWTRSGSRERQSTADETEKAYHCSAK